MGDLIGRDAELRRALDAIERVLSGDGPLALLIQGEAGIGKTALLAAIELQAAKDGAAVLRAAPLESEAPLEFAALADLLDGVSDSEFDILPAPQRRALDVALLREDPAGHEDSHPRAIAVATLTLLRGLAEQRPVLIAIDDLAWLDAPSAEVVSFVLRRGVTDRIGLVAAIRTGWVASDVPLPTDGLADEQVTRLVVGPLDELAMRQVLADRGRALDDRAAFERVYAASGGVPLFALQLAANPTWTGVGALQGSLRRLLAARLDALPARVRELLLVAAASEDGALDVVLDAVSDPVSYRVDLDLAVAAGLIDPSADAIRFVHPMVRSTILDEAGVLPVRAAHRRLAAVATRAESRARHLGLGAEGADESVAAELDEAIATAARRGAPGTAAQLAELAVDLTPRADRTARCRRLQEAARYRFDAADPGSALRLIERAIEDLDAGPARAEVLVQQVKFARYLDRPTATWINLLLQAREEAGTDLRVLADVVRDLALASANSGDVAGGLRYCDEATALARELGDDGLEAISAAGKAWILYTSGQGVDENLIETAVRGVDVPDGIEMANRPAYICGLLRLWSGDLAAARALLDVESRRLTDRTGEIGQPQILMGLTFAELWSGNWDLAEAYAEAGCQSADLAGSPSAHGLIAASRAQVHAHRGRVEAARADAEFVFDLGRRIELPIMAVFGAEALGFLLVSLRDYAGVRECVEPLLAPVAAGMMPDPAMCRTVPDGVESLVRLGDLDTAEAVLAPFAARAEALKRTWGQAVAARCEALLLAARGDLDAGSASAERALAHHERLGMPFEQARTSLVAGEIHRRARRKALARDHIAGALATFEQLGAPLWAEAARAELAGIGLRSRSDAAGPELTERERRVAELAAQGRSNLEIAGELFMSLRTVEAHLSRVYRKLGIRGRTQLAAQLSP